MPIIPAPPKFDVANAASKLPEPLQKPVATAGSFLLDMLGANDPQSQILGTMNPMEAPLVSLYKDRAARELATQEFLNTAKSHVQPIQDAANWLAQRYPRVAAHMRINPEITNAKNLAAVNMPPPSGMSEPLVLSYSEKGIARPASNIRATMAHEATHVAQALGNKDMQVMYNLANNLVGYQANPFERMAEARARSAAVGSDRMLSQFRPKVGVYNDPSMLNRIGETNGTVPRLLDTISKVGSEYGPYKTDPTQRKVGLLNELLKLRQGEIPERYRR